MNTLTIAPIQKVTAFILRPTGGAPDLLLFRHPNAGVQIPAGTVEHGETPETAILREAAEETGLTALTVRQYLGSSVNHLPKGQAYVLQSTTVYARPDRFSFNWASLRNGLAVDVLRQAAGFMQVAYKEFDQEPQRQYLTYCILGWVPETTLTTVQVRHFFLLDCHEATEASWSQRSDQHPLTPFWAPLSNLPEIISPQNEWLAVLHKALADRG